MDSLEGNNYLQRKYSPEDGPHGPKHVVSEWKEIIIKNFVAIDGHNNKVPSKRFAFVWEICVSGI
jgi:hypothetical protein